MAFILYAQKERNLIKKKDFSIKQYSRIQKDHFEKIFILSSNPLASRKTFVYNRFCEKDPKKKGAVMLC